MITTYTFGKNNKSFNTFHTSSKLNYSKIIDDIILADIINKNSYLFCKTTLDADNILLTAKPTKESKLDSAIKFLSNYKKYKTSFKCPFALNKTYTLTDGTPIVFYDDEIQIGFDTYKYADFSDFSFLNTLSTNTKKTIINIYTNGATNININLL
jgi:hypothetical protein